MVQKVGSVFVGLWHVLALQEFFLLSWENAARWICQERALRPYKPLLTLNTAKLISQKSQSHKISEYAELERLTRINELQPLCRTPQESALTTQVTPQK